MNLELSADEIKKREITGESQEIMLALNKQLHVADTDTPLEIRKKIKILMLAMQKFIDTYNIIRIDPPVKHTFTDGMYIRQWFGPAGTLVVGKIHTKAHILFVLSGTCSITTEESKTKIYAAPALVEFNAGLQKVVFCHTDTLLATVHVTDGRKTEADLPEIEREAVTMSYADVGKEDPIVDEWDLLDLYENRRIE